ncbi:MAG TPA: hypothetical protein VFG30_18055, partial [Polyangiales bacterium]|nr:hypothetical protein [Polyangiales bacterium]
MKRSRHAAGREKPSAARSGAVTLRTVRLRKPLERSLRAGHPWIYREALEAFDASPGAAVRVVDRTGRFVASGLAELGPIAVRVFSLEDRPVDDKLFSERIETAFALRAQLALPETNAYRLLHGEGDRLPGVVCDRYGTCAVLKLDGDAALAHRRAWTRALEAPLHSLGVDTLLVRSGRKDEQKVDVAWGDEPQREAVVLERGMKLVVNVYEGQKTGLLHVHDELHAALEHDRFALRLV